MIGVQIWIEDRGERRSRMQIWVGDRGERRLGMQIWVEDRGERRSRVQIWVGDRGERRSGMQIWVAIRVEPVGAAPTRRSGGRSPWAVKDGRPGSAGRAKWTGRRATIGLITREKERQAVRERPVGTCR